VQKTKTYKYLFPSVVWDLSINKNPIAPLLNKLAIHRCILNVYIGDVEYDGDSKYKIFILIENKNDILESLFIHVKESLKFHSVYQISDIHYMMVLDVSNTEAYDRLIESKYSEMYKINFLVEVFKRVPKLNAIYQILSKSEKRRLELIQEFNLKSDFEADEYDGEFNMINETFDRNLFNIRWEQQDTTMEN
jgi:hypothetical protein